MTYSDDCSDLRTAYSRALWPLAAECLQRFMTDDRVDSAFGRESIAQDVASDIGAELLFDLQFVAACSPSLAMRRRKDETEAGYPAPDVRRAMCLDILSECRAMCLQFMESKP